MDTSPSRARTVFGLVSLVVLSALASVGGVLLVALGSGLWSAGGVALLALVGGAAWALLGPRSPAAPVQVVEHAGGAALLLPPRRGHVAAVCLVTVAFGAASLLLGLAAVLGGVEGGGGRRSPTVGVLAGPPFLAMGLWMCWRAARGRGGVLLTHDALVLSSLLGADTVVPWRELHRVVPGPVPTTSARLVTGTTSDRWHVGPPTLPVGRVAWRWQQTLAVVAWCDREKRARRVLREGAPEQVQEMAARVDEVAHHALPR